MKECSNFLKGIGVLYDAFSMHSKGASYKVMSADEALLLFRQCKDMLLKLLLLYGKARE